MSDREQTQRDAVRKTAVDVSAALHDLAKSTGRVIDTLLLALEQAERERDETKEALRVAWTSRDAVRKAEARLAKVPALVGAAHKVVDFYAPEDLDDDEVDRPMAKLRAALAAFEEPGVPS